MDSFEASYSGTPPWDIGKPQLEFVKLYEEGKITGRVLDVGCGTGENSLFLAEKGLDIVGIDSAPTAIKKAKNKASQRKLFVNFLVHDALNLTSLNMEFDTIIDSGLFHIFSDEDRTKFIQELVYVLRPGGIYHMVCFSDREPGLYGPRRITKTELITSFQNEWKISTIREAVFENTFDKGWSWAWLASITRT